MLRFTLGVALFCLVFASAQGRASVDVERELTTHLLSLGAKSVSTVARDFWVEGQSHAVAQRTSQAGCLGFLAIGRDQVRDLDLTIHTASGLTLDEDVSVGAYAYVRACTAADQPLLVSLALLAGRGEVIVLRVELAPRELGRIPASIPLSVTAGGVSEPPQSVGAEVDDGGLIALLTSDETRFARLGYLALGPPEMLELQAGLLHFRARLAAGRCYRVVVYAPGLRGLSLAMVGESSTGTQGRMPGSHGATLSYCAQREGLHALRIQGVSPRGIVVLRLFEQPRAVPDALPELALGRAEIVAEFDRHGLVPERLGDGWLSSEAPLGFAVRLASGECYAAAAVSAQLAPLDVRFVDPQGRVLAHTEGRDGVPIAYACATQAGLYRIVVTGRGQERHAAVWLGMAPRPDGSAP